MYLEEGLDALGVLGGLQGRSADVTGAGECGVYHDEEELGGVGGGWGLGGGADRIAFRSRCLKMR